MQKQPEKIPDAVRDITVALLRGDYSSVGRLRSKGPAVYANLPEVVRRNADALLGGAWKSGAAKKAARTELKDFLNGTP